MINCGLIFMHHKANWKSSLKVVEINSFGLFFEVVANSRAHTEDVKAL